MVRQYESPSSINTFRQCPRRYYYTYIARYPTLPSIHLIRGNVAHKALEYFYDVRDEDLNKIGLNDYEIVLKIRIKRLLKESWLKKMKEFKKLDISRDQHIFYYRETQEMMQNWINIFLEKLKKQIKNKDSLKIAFKSLIPKREKKFKSDAFNVMGYIDAIEDHDNKIRLMDYKTSKNPKISDAYRLQLAIYSLLYYEQYNRLPDEVGIYFLKHNEQTIPVDEELLEFARLECKFIREQTQYSDIEYYPKKKSPLCKWSTGKCDFYDHCFKDTA